MMTTDDMRRAPLHFAAGAGHLDTTQLLLEAKAYLELEDATRRTALHHAARGGHLEVSSLLLDTGSRIDPQDADSRSPLHHSSRSDMLFNVTLLLLEQGANFELEDEVGFRPLHYACTFAQLQTAMKLMDLGADVWALDKSGWSPIIHAATGEEEFARVLVNRISRPREFPQPDPSRFIVLGDGSLEGFPTWLLIGLVILLLSIGIVVPGCKIIRRCQRVTGHALQGAGGTDNSTCLEYFPPKWEGQEKHLTKPRQANRTWSNTKMKMQMNLSPNSSPTWMWRKESC